MIPFTKADLDTVYEKLIGNECKWPEVNPDSGQKKLEQLYFELIEAEWNSWPPAYEPEEDRHWDYLPLWLWDQTIP